MSRHDRSGPGPIARPSHALDPGVTLVDANPCSDGSSAPHEFREPAASFGSTFLKMLLPPKAPGRLSRCILCGRDRENRLHEGQD